MAEFEALLADPSVHLFHGRQCFLLLRVVLGEAEVLTLATHPDGQRQGRATALMSKAIKAIPAKRFVLEVAADNTPACALYARLGFRTVGRRAGYYQRADGTRCDAVTMALSPQGGYMAFPSAV